MLRPHERHEILDIDPAQEHQSDFASVAELVRRLGGPVETAKARILAAAQAGRIELRPESSDCLSVVDQAVLAASAFSSAHP